jgi:hypothetical protein
VLLTSGYSEDAFQHHGRPEAGMRLLRKPYRRKDLAEILRDVLKAAPCRAPAPVEPDEAADPVGRLLGSVG